MLAEGFHRIAPWLKQSSGGYRRVNRLNRGEGLQIETDDYHAFTKTVLADDLSYCAGKIDITILRLVGFHLHIDDLGASGALFKETEDLIEGRNKLAAVFGLSKLSMGATERTAHIPLAEFAGCHAR